jgi:hypothetical protein
VSDFPGKAVRVEWAKAWARRERWREEVALLQEEMCRTLRYLTWKSDWWLQKARTVENDDVELLSGLKAYARRNAGLLLEIRERFKCEWEHPSTRKSRRHPIAPRPDLNDIGSFEEE